MRAVLVILAMATVASCGGDGDSVATAAGEAVDFCTCANEPIVTDARLKACSDLLESVSPEVAAGETMACRQDLPVPEGGPDLCFCVRTMSEDPEIHAACEALLPDDMAPLQLSRIVARCAQ